MELHLTLLKMELFKRLLLFCSKPEIYILESDYSGTLSTLNTSTWPTCSVHTVSKKYVYLKLEYISEPVLSYFYFKQVVKLAL